MRQTSPVIGNTRSRIFRSRADVSQGTAPAPSGFRPSESAESTPPRRDAARPATARETQSRGSELLRQSTSTSPTSPIVLCALLIAPLGCSGGETPRAHDGSLPTDSASSIQDGNRPNCVRPPLTLCDPPGTIAACPDDWFCPGCSCTGQFSAAACDPFSSVCRRFCTGCFPAEYISCADRNAPTTILSRCGFCFSDAGAGKCDPDAGVSF